MQLFRAKIVDVAPDAVTVEATGDSEKIEALLRVLEPFGVKELVQSGMVAIGRGSRSIADRPLRPVTPEDVRAHHEGNHAHTANGSRDTHNRTHRKQMSDHHG